MRTSRWLSLLAALVLLGAGSGCPGPGPCFNSSTPLLPDRPVFEVGKEAVFQVPVGVGTHCEGLDGPPQVPETVTVTVHGPENQPIPATAELISAGTQARVRFTPPETGRYHVLIAFAPVGSLQQFGVFVAEDRRQEPPMARLTWASTCPYVDRTTRGTWLCGPMAMRAEGGSPQQLASNPEQVAVAGDVVWAVEGSRVVRYVDTGTGPLVATANAPYPPDRNVSSSHAVHARLATQSELVVLVESYLYRYTFTPEGGVRAAPPTRWLPQVSIAMGNDQVAGLLVRTGDRLQVLNRFQESVTFELRTQACPFQAATADGPYARVQGEPCQPLDGDVVGYEDGGVWTRSVAFGPVAAGETLRRYSASGHRLVEEGVLSLDGQLLVNLPSLRPGAVLPPLFGVLNSGISAGPRWSPEKRTVELELTPRFANTGPARLGQRYYWVDSIQGGPVAVYPRARPSTP